jgi:anti-anti-sigma factor
MSASEHHDTMSPVTMFANRADSVVTVAGDLDMTTAPDLKRLVTDFFKADDSPRTEVLTLDLSAVSACDEAVLDALLHAQVVCADRAVALRVTTSDAVRRVMAEGSSTA